jgi:serine/threonine protein kinase
MIAAGMEACPGYKLTKRLGRGGFGEVWEAQTNATGSIVALKFLDCRNQHAGMVANEIKLLVSLRELKHPHLIQLKSITTVPNYIVIVMERADGSLNDLHYIYREDYKTHMPPLVLCNLLEQAAVALDFLAEQRVPAFGFSKAGLQHCDVKPSNLLLLGDQIKVADFGLSGAVRNNTHSNVVMGTPPYAAPELFEGRSSPRTDQFGLAVAYCELRCGHFPLPVTKDLSYPNIPPDLNRLPTQERPVVARALHKQWLDRWPSCTAFIQALRQVVDHNPMPTSGNGRSRPSSRRMLAV